MAEPFEYAIKKDVRNNPIVREVDRHRQREMWKSVGICGVLVLVLLFSAWQHFELLRHGYRLEQMQKDRVAEEEINRHLKLEIETPAHLIDLNGLALDRIDSTPQGGLRIGALVRNTDLAADLRVRRDYGLLSRALLAGVELAANRTLPV